MHNFAFLLSLGLHFHPILPFQNVKPRKLLFVGLTILVFVALTFKNSFLSSHHVIDFITLSAAISLFTKMLPSSAYLTKRSPLSSSSLSSLSKYIFDSTGLSGPPCGTPASFGLTSPSSITPAFKNERIRCSISLSFTCSLSIEINLSWCTVSKYFSISMSITHSYPSFRYSNTCSIALCALLLGRNP